MLSFLLGIIWVHSDLKKLIHQTARVSYLKELIWGKIGTSTSDLSRNGVLDIFLSGF